MERKKVTVLDLLKKKERGEKITKVNVYDYPTAVLADRVGFDIIGIGDSVGMVVLGYENTIPVTMEDMIHHAKAVVRGVKNAFVICDLPFLTYNVSEEQAIRNAGRLMQEAGVDAVKLEGGEEVKHIVKAIVDAGIPVNGHIGLTPQRVAVIGGYRVQGRDAATGRMIIEDAKALEAAGAFAITLECVTLEVAKKITETLKIPTIGIGSGPYCDAQTLILHDIIGLSLRLVPKFAKRYVDVKSMISQGLETFKREVQTRKYPDEEHSFHMQKEETDKL